MIVRFVATSTALLSFVSCSESVSDLFDLNLSPFVVVSSLAVPGPSYLAISKFFPGTLYVSSFGKDIDGQVSRVPFKAMLGLGDSESELEVVSKDLSWPNRVAEMTLGTEELLVVANGFFSPPFSSRNAGSIGLIRLGENGLAQGEVKRLGEVGARWFYHLPKLRDMDNDGNLDIVTARTNWSPLPFSGQAKGELVYFKNPGSFDAEWAEVSIVEGPEVYFDLVDLDRDGVEEILASETFQESLSVYKNVGGVWKRRAIDDKIGRAFDVRAGDLNGDGLLDILATNHQADESAAVFAYEIPGDVLQGTFKKHTLASGFITTQPGTGQASPGSAKIYAAFEGRKPWLLVSGDGTQQVHLLRPQSEDPENWIYSESVIFDAETSLIGEIQQIDLDEDGALELLVPAYNNNEIHVLKRN